MAKEMDWKATIAEQRPVVLVTNDDGIDAPGLRSLVAQLVSARYAVLVSAPDKSVPRFPSSFFQFFLFYLSESSS
jgi:Survival protein SurE